MFKKMLCLVLIALSIISLCACGPSKSNTGNTTRSEADEVIEAVESAGLMAYYGTSIGGNDIKTSYVDMSTVKQVSDNEYKVSGKIYMVDVYGTRWQNTFDCTVTKNSSGKWSAGSLIYKSNSWSKG